MSENLEEVRSRFHELHEGLKDVHTQEDLDRQRKRLKVATTELETIDPDFHDLLIANQRLAERGHDKLKVSITRESIDKTAIVKPLNENIEIVCCPECMRVDTQNKMNRLNRKQRRRHPKIKGHKVHEDAFCIYCNSRMVYMPRQEQLEQRINKEEKRVVGKKW